MKTSLERIRLGAIVFAAILVVAVIGYRIAGRDWVDAFFMVVITISSVGYAEESSLSPKIQLFTVAVILFGMSAAAYTIGGFIQMMIEGEIDTALGRRRITRGIQQLKEHIIICGFGRIGQILAQDLIRQARAFVIIDSNPERIVEAQQHEYLVLLGDATEEDILLTAGVERAKTLVTGLPNDAANVFITLTSRNLNPNLQIVSRAEYSTTEKKLLQAGANRVVMPATIGAQRLARIITHPTTADLMDLLTDRSMLEVELDEVTIRAQSPLNGITVRDAEAHRRHGLLVVAVKNIDGKMVFNPGGDYTFQGEDTLIVMGPSESIDRFRNEFRLTR